MEASFQMLCGKDSFLNYAFPGGTEQTNCISKQTAIKLDAF